jgi:hypothetical protein
MMTSWKVEKCGNKKRMWQYMPLLF